MSARNWNWAVIVAWAVVLASGVGSVVVLIRWVTL